MLVAGAHHRAQPAPGILGGNAGDCWLVALVLERRRAFRLRPLAHLHLRLPHPHQRRFFERPDQIGDGRVQVLAARNGARMRQAVTTDQRDEVDIAERRASGSAAGRQCRPVPRKGAAPARRGHIRIRKGRRRRSGAIRRTHRRTAAASGLRAGRSRGATGGSASRTPTPRRGTAFRPFPIRVRIAICLKSEDDTKDTPDTRYTIWTTLNRDCVGFAMLTKNKDQVSGDPLALR